MRIALALVGVALLLAGGAAFAAPPRVRVIPPRTVVAWEPATLTVVTRGRSKPTQVVLRNGGTALPFALRRAAPRRYRARATIPYAGAWRVTVRIGGRLLAAGAIRVAAAAPLPSAIPGATAFRICSGTGEPYPQYALARDAGGLWVGCRNNSQLLLFDPSAGATTALLRLGGYGPHTIAAAGGAIWAVDRSTSLTRIDPANGRRTASALESDSSYVFSAAGSVWVAEDGSSTLARVDPATGAVAARIPTGSGTSAIVADGPSAWFVNHREGTLERLDLATNAVAPLGRLPGDAPERMVLYGGSLWVTGRGTDLLRVNPATGAVQATVEVGAGAIDVTAAGGSIWVFAPNTNDDLRGFPFVERVLRVDPATNTIAETITTTGRVVLNGLVSDGNAVWLADTSGGRLYRIGP